MIPEQSVFICPICSGRLFRVDSSLKCMSGHSFDLAKQGYVNLLMKNSARRRGDDRLMLLSRRAFLEKGYYNPLRNAVNELLGEGHTVLDSGCGEGYYTSVFCEKNRVCGIDISKDAVALSAGRCKNAEFAVASISAIPLADSSVDTVINIFAPDSPEEFKRILTPHGRLISALPDTDHLFELKAAVYEKPYKNPPPKDIYDGFQLKNIKRLDYTLELDCTEDIKALFCMTPYYYKTSAEDRGKLDSVKALKTRAQFTLLEFEKV